MHCGVTEPAQGCRQISAPARIFRPQRTPLCILHKGQAASKILNRNPRQPPDSPPTLPSESFLRAAARVIFPKCMSYAVTPLLKTCQQFCVVPRIKFSSLVWRTRFYISGLKPTFQTSCITAPGPCLAWCRLFLLSCLWLPEFPEFPGVPLAFLILHVLFPVSGRLFHSLCLKYSSSFLICLRGLSPPPNSLP